eukprot:gb/GEZJ01008016.1/.p1 GENE.gb/GEZJ01008016.1/~~gb/GEZJ01008016.1/.p1  ORF type:complete len:115 (+),score=11.78 gb/GEZJ01008016.1/:158-502(+)
MSLSGFKSEKTTKIGIRMGKRCRIKGGKNKRCSSTSHVMTHELAEIETAIWQSSMLRRSFTMKNLPFAHSNGTTASLRGDENLYQELFSELVFNQVLFSLLRFKETTNAFHGAC